MNIALIGYRGVGKSSVAKKLGKMLGWKVFETDRMVEQMTGKKVAEIVKEKGWGRFRQLEAEAVRKAAAEDKVVIATGGGAVMQAENARRLKKGGLLVLLKADADVIKRRLKLKKERLPLLGRNSISEVEEVLTQRMPVYESLADFAIDTTDESIEQVASTIAKGIKKVI